MARITQVHVSETLAPGAEGYTLIGSYDCTVIWSHGGAVSAKGRTPIEAMTHALGLPTPPRPKRSA